MAKDKIEDIIDEDSTEIVEVKASGVPATQYGPARGMENVNVEAITFPVAKLLQSMSVEVQDKDYDFKAGEVIHSLFMERLGEDFVPVSVQESNAMFVPKNDAEKRLLKSKVTDRFGVVLSDDDMKNLFVCRAA